jgi:acyl-CoA reductase-like NAD-dependent aldehyde dehydrogenase
MPVTNSSTGEVMAQAPRCTAAEVNAAVAAGAAALSSLARYASPGARTGHVRVQAAGRTRAE